jgi:chromosome segregation ATPase
MTDDLRRLAEAARDEVWYRRDSYLFKKGVRPKDAAFIAAANPATVLALLDERDELRKDRDRLRELAHENATAFRDWRRRAETVEADLAAADARADEHYADYLRIVEAKEVTEQTLVVVQSAEAKALAENAALRERITELEEQRRAVDSMDWPGEAHRLNQRCQRLRAQIHRTNAERDRLQVRIDKALALCASWEREAAHWTDHAESVTGDKRAKSYALASKYRDAADQLRAALSDTAGPEDTALDDFRIDNPEAGA